MSKEVIDKLKRSAQLPSAPGTALEVLRLCQTEDASIGVLADTLATDPALCLRLLKYANSAMFGASKEIASVRDAVLMLGLRSVRVMALGFSLVSTRDPKACKAFEFDRFWAHSVARAAAARHLAARLRIASPEEAFSIGLLSHIGKLAFAVGMPDLYPAVLQVAGGTLARAERHETACLGCSHYDLGADLLIEWGLPQYMADIVRAQSHPDTYERDSEMGRWVSLIRAATDTGDIVCKVSPDYILATRRQSIINSGLIPEEEVDQVLQSVKAEFNDLVTILSVKPGTRPRDQEIQAKAGAMLNELRLSAQLQSEAAEKGQPDVQPKAATDELTGIANRRSFDQRLAEVLEESRIKGDSLALVMMDIDSFKQFNDTFGHTTGDVVLQAVTQTLLKTLRSADLLARYGGEEFAAILPRADRLLAAQLCVRLRRAVEVCTVKHGGRNHRVTISVGAALTPVPLGGCGAKTLLQVAQAELRAAKAKGRNCCSMRQIASPMKIAPAPANPR
ncbi:MAG TPA: GGDEF domain-containing protein [Phycisphaerae bacterium]|nr:GGDEF domain-containing protein [Phycisphaerae bacterium]HRY68325.1 GGDEF domain-containing protein [Phycisphaerae bacterium]HSA26792.1 GGDEF domain-containing protein [Phycisphaerae bacterium]